MAQKTARHFNNVMLGSIELFCLCARHESFTAAAAAAGLTPPAVSRAVLRLEQRLGVKLFTRTTRSMRLTDSGQAYYEQCQEAIERLTKAERDLTGKQARPTGSVSISVPTSYGHYFVLPLLPEFRQRYPDVTLHLDVSNHNIDFMVDGFDLAIRGGEQRDSGLIARRLEAAQLVVVATPEYLKRYGAPHAIESLAEHDCIQFLHPRTGQPIPWLFQVDGRDVEVKTKGGITCAGDILSAVTLVRNGGGVLQTFRAAVEHDLQQGTLKELLPDLSGGARPFSIVYHSNRHMPLRMRVLIDFLAARLGHVN